MASNLFNSALALNAGAAFSNILPAGNYYIEAISLGISTMTGVAAGAMVGSVFLTNGTFANIYGAIQVSAVAPAAPFLMQTNYVLSIPLKLICKRGDPLYLNMVNTLNAASCVAVGNIWGANLP